MTSLARHAGYGTSQIRTDRDIEYDAFARVTSALRLAVTRNDSQDLIRAVHINSELWTILAADLSHPGNALPDQTRAGLLSLAGFSVRHGRAVMNGSAGPDSLIDVNIAIMKGLRGEVKA